VNGRRIIATALLAAAACVPAAPALADATATAPYTATTAAVCPSPDAKAVVTSLNELTTAMQQITGPAGQISASNLPLVLIGQGPVPQVITGLNSTAILASQAVAQLSALKSLSGCNADAVTEAYQAFVGVSQQTISVLMGKAAVSAQIPFVAGPIAAALRQVESVNDALAFALIDLLPDSAGALVNAGAAALDSSLDTAISEFSNAGA
jgi:hypothetical protein